MSGRDVAQLSPVRGYPPGGADRGGAGVFRTRKCLDGGSRAKEEGGSSTPPPLFKRLVWPGLVFKGC